MNGDNVVTLDVIRIERDKPRKCTCDPYDLHFTVDTVNKEVTCGCGMVVEPYTAIEYLARHYDRLNDQHKAMNEQRIQWQKEKPHSVLFKSLERDYQRGKMLPCCPRCQQPFDYKEINGHTNAEFYRRWKAKQQNQEER